MKKQIINAQIPDEEDNTLLEHSIFWWARKFVVLRNGYKYFNRNKGWILSLLFVLSTLRSSIWYALFGINILTYSNLQDIFISFADYFMSIIFIIILIVCFYFFFPQNIKNKYEKILLTIFLVIVFIALLWGVLSLYRLLFPILHLIIISLFFIVFLASKIKIAFLHLSIFLLVGLSLFQPMEQYLNITAEKKIMNQFVERRAHYDYISFDYNNTHIDTKTNIFYLIGDNSNYFFVFNRELQETLIIPKSECKSIKSHLFRRNCLLFLQ